MDVERVALDDAGLTDQIGSERGRATPSTARNGDAAAVKPWVFTSAITGGRHPSALSNLSPVLARMRLEDARTVRGVPQPKRASFGAHQAVVPLDPGRPRTRSTAAIGE